MQLQDREVEKFFDRKGIVTLVWIVVASGAAWAFSTAGAKGTPEGSSQPARTIFPASIRPHTFVSISSEFPGQVGEIRVQPGTPVKTGQVLLRLNDPEFEWEYQRAKVRYEDMERRLQNQVAGSGTHFDSQSQIEAAERTLRAAKARLAAFSLEGAEAGFRKAADRASLMDQLLERKLVTDMEAQQAKEAESTSERILRSEQEHLSRLQDEVRLAEERVQEAGHNPYSPQATAFSLKMDLREGEEALRIAKQRRDAQEVVATIDGTVLRSLVHEGDRIPSGVPIIQIGRLDLLDIEVPAGAELSRKVKAGDKVEVRIPTEPPAQVSARISEVTLLPTQDQTAYSIRVLIPNPAPTKVLVGLTAEVEFAHSEVPWRNFRF